MIKSDFAYFNRDAYKVACLGITDGDWRSLGMAALEVLSLQFFYLFL